MSRTCRTRSKGYYGFTPVQSHESKGHTSPDDEYYRCRFFHGYDGGWSGEIRHAYRAGVDFALGYGDRGAGRKGKRFSKRRAGKLNRQIAKTLIQAKIDADHIPDY